MKKLTVRHWYGRNDIISQKTGLNDREVFEEYDLMSMIQICFDNKYNVSLINAEETIVFFISDRLFGQR